MCIPVVRRLSNVITTDTLLFGRFLPCWDSYPDFDKFDIVPGSVEPGHFFRLPPTPAFLGVTALVDVLFGTEPCEKTFTL